MILLNAVRMEFTEAMLSIPRKTQHLKSRTLTTVRYLL
ncbi:hypothetical protein EVA_15057 [gut metagenome]|uniref:Uncharacterized protein n=1 Tax=gut metagenome TaxID=749906 RepID=J9G4U4_9ZZZZ